MKLPEFVLANEIKISTDHGEHVFPAGTHVTPIWNNSFLPDHKKVEIDKANRYSMIEYIFCVVGPHWVILSPDQVEEKRR